MNEIETLRRQAIDLIMTAHEIDTEEAKSELESLLIDCLNDDEKIVVLRAWIEVFANAD